MKRKLLIYKTQMKEAVSKLFEEDRSMAEKIEQEYQDLLSENDLSDKMLAKHLKKSIIPSIAVYKTMINKSMGREYAYQMVRESVLYDAKKNQKIFQRIGKLPFGYFLIKIMTPLAVKSNFGKTGWDFDWKRSDRHGIEFDCHRCFYFDIFQKYSVLELTSIFCESDDVVYGSIPNITWARTKTIGNGDEVCDFKFFKSKDKGQDKV